MDLAGGEGGHDLVLLPGLHAPVDAGHSQMGKDLLLEHFRVLRGGLAVVGDLVVLLHHRADDVRLPAGGDLLVQEFVDPLAVAAGDGEGVDLLPSGGQLVNDRYVQVPVDHQRQGPGDGGGGHDQQMGPVPFGCQGGPLGHAEAVLLIGDHQAQAAVGHVGGDEGVGADGYLGFPALQGRQDGAPLPDPHGPGEKNGPDAQLFQQGGQPLIVLLRQNLGGGHEGGLPPVPDGAQQGGGGYHCLAAAYVPLDQPVHGPS